MAHLQLQQRHIGDNIGHIGYRRWHIGYVDRHLATATEAHWQVKFVHSDVTDGDVCTLQAIAVGAET